MSSHYLFKATKQEVATVYQKITLILLADIANEHGQCYPSIGYLAQCASCSPSTIKKALSELRDLGLLDIQERRIDGTSLTNIYTLTLNEGGCVTTPPVASKPTPSRAVTPRGSAGNYNTPTYTPNNTNSNKFTKPTLADITAFIMQNSYNVDAANFFDYYESNGWMVGKSKMKDWKATVRRWSRNNKTDGKRASDAIHDSMF